MSSTLQNRLVGTIIVVALVVILVPEFLDGEKRINKQEFENVPPVAELVKVQSTERFDTSEVEQELNQPVELVNEIPVDDDSVEEAAQTANMPNTNTTEVNEVNENTIENVEEQIPSEDDLSDIVVKDSGWVVQLGSFKHEKNVKELLNTLNNAGYRAYSRPVMTSVGELTKVFVGPELDKNKLELALPHLTEITKLKGKITAFEVSAG